MEREAVARAAGNEAHGRRRVDERLGDLVHGAVAADRHDPQVARAHRVLAMISPVAWPRALGAADVGLERGGPR